MRTCAGKSLELVMCVVVVRSRIRDPKRESCVGLLLVCWVYYPRIVTQGYLLVFAINDDTSFTKLDRVKNAVQAAQAKSVPIFLVGTKSDLEEERAVSRKEAENKAKQWGSKYYEVSSKTDTGVSQVFEDIVRAVLEDSSDPTKGSSGGSVFAGGKAPKEMEGPRRGKGKNCTIL